MTTIQKLKEIGESMGLKGEDLQAFVKQQQADERAARERDRTERELERSEREKERIFEIERLKIENEQKQRERAIEVEHAQVKEKQMELELKRIQLETGQSNVSLVGLDERTDPKVIGKVPKMPYFDDDRDFMDSYLNRFERFAEAQRWKKDDLATYLSALLKGRALDVYSRLPPEQANDYDALKHALLKRYQLSAEGFKTRFRSAKPEVGEVPIQFLTRLDNYLQRWIELSNADKTFEGLKTLIIQEQYISVCPKDLALFLKERAPSTLAELGTLAEQFIEAHSDKTVPLSEVKQIGTPRQPVAPKRCFSCGSPSHLAKNCPGQLPYKPRSSIQAERQAAQVRSNQSQDTKRTCFICGRSNHLARNCFHRNRTGALETNTLSRQLPNKTSSNPFQTKQPTYFEYECTQHAQMNCTDCMRPRESFQHSCNAIVGPEVVLQCGCKIPVVADACKNQENRNSQTKMPVVYGYVGDKRIDVLRDTGCSTVVVRRSLVSPEQLTGREELCVLIDGTVRRVPVANIDINTPYLCGRVAALCMKQPLYDLIIGNVPGVADEIKPDHRGQAVVTRSQSQPKTSKPLRVPQEIETVVSKADLIKMQKEDRSLEKAMNSKTGSVNSGDHPFIVLDGLLFRRHRTENGDWIKQLVLPTALRSRVMHLAHDGVMSGHQGIRRTCDRISTNFWWYGMTGDITRFCRSCDVCQRTIARGRVPKTPLGRVPIIDTPFKRVAVDLVGPMFPPTNAGHRYILTLVDYATRYPEAVPLKNIEAITVAEALVSMFSRVGVPSEILSDQGSQFTSTVMKEVSRLLSMKQLTTTPYHPQCNGLVERFNGTLKTMLKRMCAEKPKDWNRYLDALLFAYREVPQESLGFSPFEMLYGRTVRGPMTILRELWTKEHTEPDIRTTYSYVVDLRDRLQETWDMAHEQLRKSQMKQKRLFDCKAKDRSFKAGDKVLVLLPTNENKLIMQWKGPFEVIEHISGSDYRVQLPTRIRVLHANLLKKYFDRESEVTSSPSQATPTVVAAAILEAEDQTENDEMPLGTFNRSQTETFQDVKINSKLSDEQRLEVERLLAEYSDIFTDVPNVTNLGEHSINLTSSEPIRGKAYTLPHSMRETLDKEIDTMLSLGVIEPSASAYASPVVLVKKPDGSTRVCVDYRKLNRATVFDPEPIPKVDEIFAKLSKDTFFSKFDLSKGYWQVPMKEEDKDITTFVCHRGLFRFNVMPFGLVNAPATFSRIMRRLLRDSHGLDNYLDDVLAHDRQWKDHVENLKDFFRRIREAKLTLRPSKCEVGNFDVAFLGHLLSDGKMQPREETVDKILEAPRPVTKAQLRSFLGLASFYRKYVPNFAAISVPLTDATRKGSPNVLEWGDAHESAFDTLKKLISSPPILRLADPSKPFILQTDASNVGIGAILLQEDEEGTKHPVAFASRKLLPRETRYSTIEKECLAIVWGVAKFQEYLYGNEFILETDHHPLQYLSQTQFQNGRLMRWSLALQPYRFVLRAIHGKDNVGADFMSRYPPDTE